MRSNFSALLEFLFPKGYLKTSVVENRLLKIYFELKVTWDKNNNLISNRNRSYVVIRN